MVKIKTIVEKINLESKNYKIGSLQEIRKGIKKLNKQPGNAIFQAGSIFDNYAFHFGGRKELQFNIGFEKEGLRYGVAFSLERSQTLPDISMLYPKIRRFNQFVRGNPIFFKKYKIWNWFHGIRAPISHVVEIKEELLQADRFIFIGKILKLSGKISKIGYNKILHTFDELLSLYQFVENSSLLPNDTPNEESDFEFIPGKGKLPDHITKKYTSTAKQIDLDVRHSLIQKKLWKKLVLQYGKGNIRLEHPYCGMKIDLVLNNNGQNYFYEVKTASSARACIREAIGQLMEYAYWPGRKNAVKIIVVGEHNLDKKTRKYLDFLKTNFSLPVEYIVISIGNNKYDS